MNEKNGLLLEVQEEFAGLLNLLREAQGRGDLPSCRVLLSCLRSLASTRNQRQNVARQAAGVLCEVGAPEQAAQVLTAEQPAALTTEHLMAWVQVMQRADQISLAEVLIEEAFLRCEHQVRPPILASLLNQRGYLFRRLGDWEAAHICYQKAFQHADRGVSPRIFASIVNNISNVVSLKGHYQASIRLVEVALRMRHRLWRQGTLSPSALATSYSTKGLLWLRAGDLDQSEIALRAALGLFALSPHRLRAAVLDRLGQLALLRGHLPQAQQWLESALQHAQEVGNEEAAISSEYHLGELALRQEAPLRASRYFREAMERAAACSDLAQLAESLVALQSVSGADTHHFVQQQEAFQMIEEARRPLLQAHLQRLQAQQRRGRQRLLLPSPVKKERERGTNP